MIIAHALGEGTPSVPRLQDACGKRGGRGRRWASCMCLLPWPEGVAMEEHVIFHLRNVAKIVGGTGSLSLPHI